MLYLLVSTPSVSGHSYDAVRLGLAGTLHCCTFIPDSCVAKHTTNFAEFETHGNFSSTLVLFCFESLAYHYICCNSKHMECS